MSHPSRGFCATGVSSGQNHRLMAHNVDSEPIRTRSRITPRSTGGARSWVLMCWTAISGSGERARLGKAGEGGDEERGKAQKGKAACACAHAVTQRSSAVDSSVLRRISFGANSLAGGGGGKWVAWRRGGNEW